MADPTFEEDAVRFRQLLSDAFGYALDLTRRPISAKAIQHGWTQEAMERLSALLVDWRGKVNADVNPGQHNRRHMVRWFLDNSLDTDGVGQAVLAVKRSWAAGRTDPTPGLPVRQPPVPLWSPVIPNPLSRHA